MSFIPESSANRDRRNLHPAMKFRAVIAGWLVATGVAGLLYVGGLALGFSSFDAWNAAGSAKGLGIGTALWVIITWAAALFFGGMFAAWFDGRNDDTMGAPRGDGMGAFRNHDSPLAGIGLGTFDGRARRHDGHAWSQRRHA